MSEVGSLMWDGSQVGQIIVWLFSAHFYPFILKAGTYFFFSMSPIQISHFLPRGNENPKDNQKGKLMCLKENDLDLTDMV